MAEKLVQLLTVSAVGTVLLLSFGVVSGIAADKIVETTGSIGNYNWTPESTEINAGGTVEFKNAAGGGSHALQFQAPPAAPSCPGVPTVGTANWSGTCTFTQAGTYSFICPVHPTEMTGTITVQSTGPQSPTVTAEAPTAVKDTEATLKGSVNPNGEATTYWFEYGTSTSYDHETTHLSAGSGTTSVSKSATVMGLSANTPYHFRMVAENGTGKTNGDDRTFTTGGPPTVTTEPATGVRSVEATLKGSVNPHGLETTYFFNYGTTEAYGQKTTEKSAGSGTTNVAKTEVVIGLLPETTYHFQVVAKNSAGGGSEVKGADQMFTTTGFDPPVSTTGQASGVGETAATLEGVVNPKGTETKYFFNYGTTTAYGQKTTEASAGKGTSNVNVSAPLAGLSPATTYHFQLVAKNAGGESKGSDQTFTTGSTPPPPPPPPPPPLPAPPVIPPETGGAPPDTKITLKPAAKTRDTTPTIKFKATAGGATYKCSVDSKPFKTCRSPFTTPVLKPGSHKIRVKAAIGGAADPTPASCSFKVVAAKK
jgi:plastocyanin